MKRYFLQLRGSESGESGAGLPARHLDFRRREDAEEWALHNSTGVQLTTWQVVDRGPWWTRLRERR